MTVIGAPMKDLSECTVPIVDDTEANISEIRPRGVNSLRR